MMLHRDDEAEEETQRLLDLVERQGKRLAALV
jgi:hypothetical protein